MSSHGGNKIIITLITMNSSSIGDHTDTDCRCSTRLSEHHGRCLSHVTVTNKRKYCFKFLHELQRPFRPAHTGILTQNRDFSRPQQRSASSLNRDLTQLNTLKPRPDLRAKANRLANCQLVSLLAWLLTKQ